ncbi:MAG: hypothetical protein Q8M73_00120 [Actinomycetota bacterium]|nr:hypothetical protein [Actinomycetota bacterium]
MTAFILCSRVVAIGGHDVGMTKQGSGFVLGAAAIDDDTGCICAQVFDVQGATTRIELRKR